MDPRITIGIPTCARPEKIKACLASIQRHVHLEHQVIIVDSRITDQNRQLYEAFPNTRLIAFESPIGPSAARELIAKNTGTPYLLFMDDDNEVTPGAVEVMYECMEANEEVDIVGGGWREYGRHRPLGQRFNFGTAGDKKVVYKTYVTIKELLDLGLTSVRVDLLLVTMLVRCRIFDKVQFDPRYGFYFDLFDFFLQCYHKGLVITALPGVIFEHKPTRYVKPTLRQQSDQEDDRRRLIEKWGVHPVGRMGGFHPSALTRLKQRALPFLLRNTP